MNRQLGGQLREQPFTIAVALLELLEKLVDLTMVGLEQIDGIHSILLVTCTAVSKSYS